MQRRLDGYTLIELIGFGPSGEVWRAGPQDGGPDVVLTWLLDEGTEADLLAWTPLLEFAHPHVAKLLDVRSDGVDLVLVEEFVPGRSLARLLIEQQALDADEAAELLIPVADAMTEAHADGLLHGCLSPAAILITPDGRPVVTDLGVRQRSPQHPSPHSRRDYLDPSVVGGAAIEESSDVFSLAAICHHAITGRSPGTPDGLPSGLPSSLIEAITRGLSEQPECRGTAAEFAADLRDSLDPEPGLTAGAYVWPNLADLADDPDLPAFSDSDSDPLDGLGAGTERDSAPDIAAAVRRAASNRQGAGAVRRRSALRLAVPRQTVVSSAFALAIVAVLVLGFGWGSSNAPLGRAGPVGSSSSLPPEGPAESTTSADSAGVDERATPASPEAWESLLSLLYDRRAAAFGTGATALLGQVFTPDSPQLVADSAELARLITAGQLLRGFAPRVVEIVAAEIAADRASVQLTDEFGDYETVPVDNPSADALASHPGRGPAAVAMTLVLTEQGWRIHSAQRLA